MMFPARMDRFAPLKAAMNLYMSSRGIFRAHQGFSHTILLRKYLDSIRFFSGLISDHSHNVPSTRAHNVPFARLPPTTSYSMVRRMSKLAGEALETYNNKDGIKVKERFFSLPLDYSRPKGEKIRVFVRNLIPRDKAKAAGGDDKLPYLLYLQGGPGFEVALQGSSGFAAEIHEQGYQTLWLDPRGTGFSTPLSAEVLASKSSEEKADYLKHFRADSIVKDCEAIRKKLLGRRADPEDRKWTILGQSFGGFCAITYLSFYSEGLKEVFLTGGLPPLIDSLDTIYDKLAKRVIKRNKVYYRKYPYDIERVRTILRYLDENPVALPNGGRLSPSRWLQLGIAFGAHGGIDQVHQLVFRAANDLQYFGKLTYKLLQNVQEAQSFDGNPLYAVLHEALYCQGQKSDWSAARVIEKYPQCSWATMKDSEGPVYFTGEMIFPDMLDDYSNLRPLKKTSQILSQYNGWGPLYDLKQLAKNEVKVTAAVYMEDMYVDYDLSQETAAKIKGTELFITNRLFHDALRTESKTVMKNLLELSKRERD